MVEVEKLYLPKELLTISQWAFWNCNKDLMVIGYENQEHMFPFEEGYFIPQDASLDNLIQNGKSLKEINKLINISQER